VVRKAIAQFFVMIGVVCGAGLACADSAMNGSFNVTGYNSAVLISFSLQGDAGSGLKTITESGYGGNMIASFNGTALTTMYCIDIPNNINVPTGNISAYANNFSTPIVPNDTLSNNKYIPTTGGFTTNAGGIAYVMNVDATLIIGNTTLLLNEQAGLQAALWRMVYGSNFTLTGATLDANGYITAHTSSYSNDFVTEYNKALSDGLTHLSFNADNALWISPYSGAPLSGTTVPNYATMQAQVSAPLPGGFQIITPVPGNLVLSSIFLGMVGVVSVGKRLLSSSRAA